nr:glucosyltransferase [Crocus sativus]
MEDDNGKKLHIVMLPWPAFGHLLPFLELSKRLAGKGHRISFISTPKNLQRLPPQLSPLINFVAFPSPSIENLPSGAEATIDLPHANLLPYLFEAFDASEESLCKLLDDPSHPPVDWLVYDFAAYWAPRVAAKFNLPCAFFSIFTVAELGFLGSPKEMVGKGDREMSAEGFTVVPKWVPFPSTVAYRLHEARKTLILEPRSVPEGSRSNVGFRFSASVEGCDFVAVRSCMEFDPDWLQLIRKLYSKPVVAAGMLPQLGGEEEEAASGKSWESALKWLDLQEAKSVVYAAFGSEAKLTVEQVGEIALGLESSGLKFIWTLRADGLPRGFEERTKDRGMVWMGWIPQTKFLAHSSVGGFLTHCGSSSIVEGLSFGLVMVALPMVFTQGLNARYVVDKKIGVEVPRNEEDGTFTGRGIADSLKLAMLEEEGKDFRAKANECKGIVGNEEIQDRCLDDLVKFLWDHSHKKASTASV